jgi:hypothetical protein
MVTIKIAGFHSDEKLLTLKAVRSKISENELDSWSDPFDISIGACMPWDVGDLKFHCVGPFKEEARKIILHNYPMVKKIYDMEFVKLTVEK